MRMQAKLRKFIVRGSWVALGLLGLTQLVPYGRDHTNPPVVSEPPWSSPKTRELFFRACKDCHSNETHWPWYASVAPASWLVHNDVTEGRSKFNVSRWGRGRQEADEAAGLVREGEMPPWFYLPAHPGARLAAADKQELIRELIETFGDEKKERAGDDD